MPPTNRKDLDSKRVLARLIDGLLVGIPALVLMAAGVIDDTLAVWLVALAVQLAYFFMLEATVGQTVGKQLLGLKVMRMDGTPAGVAAIATRTVLRVLEDNLLGLLVMVLSGKRRQRIGDLLGSTTVTRATDIPELPAPSPLVVIYPVFWVAAALAYGAWTKDETEYLQQVAAICKARTDVQDGMGQPIPVDAAIEMSGQETRRIAGLHPPESMREWHRLVLSEKRQFDRLGHRALKDVAAADDPQQAIDYYVPRLEAEAAEHNQLFADAGLHDCAR